MSRTSQLEQRLRVVESNLEMSKERNEQLQQQLDNALRIQTAVLRRIHMLPTAVSSLINTGDITDTAISADGMGMTYSIGGLELKILPFAEQIVLVDKSGDNAPLTIPFGVDEDFDRDKVIKLAGYAELARRGGPGKTINDTVDALNTGRVVA